MPESIVVLTGAGISAESGLGTFRGQGGLWENHKVEDVATPEAFERNPELVLRFYNERRKNLLKTNPNSAHKALVELEQKFDVQIITQNVDDLHERAGSGKVMHLHGELLKVRSSVDETLVYDWNKNLKLGDLCEKGSQLRPHIVWFGEAVHMLTEAINCCSKADLLMVIGTSLAVYPAAGLSHMTRSGIPKYFVDKNIPGNAYNQGFEFIEEQATIGVPALVRKLLSRN